MKIISYTIISITIFLTSCSKDKLTDEKQVFIGSWKLAFLIREESGQNSAGTWIVRDTIEANTLEDEYSILFKEKGRLKMLRNEKELICGRIHFFKFEEALGSSNKKYEYGLTLNNDSKWMMGDVSNYTLSAVYDGFPYAHQETSTGGIVYIGVYNKQ